MKFRSAQVALTLAVAGAIALSGCANNEDDENAGGEPTGTAAAAFDLGKVTKDDALAGQVPDAVKSDGKLVVGTDPSYAPIDFKDASNKIIGFDIDLGDAIAKKLGLTAEFQESSFDNLLGGTIGPKYEIGMSAFTVKVERQKTYDFVQYFQAGNAWAAKDSAFNPADPCGKKIAVQTATYQETEFLPNLQKSACAGKSPMQIQKYTDQTEATSAVVNGKAEAMVADSPVTAYAVKQSKGALTEAGDPSEVAPYGIALPKGSPLVAPVQAALKALMADGTYKLVLDKWGLGNGAVTEPKLNGAES